MHRTNIEWNEVTWYSKLAAVIFFLLVFPIIIFYIGREYQRTVTDLDNISQDLNQKNMQKENQDHGSAQNQGPKITQAEAEEIAEKDAGFLGTWVTSKLEQDGWHINARSKSARPPALYIINSSTGEIIYRNLNTDETPVLN